ncbi:MAG: cholesterol oxidase [Gammaproteobacteria bacterium]|nr:MAG: cholesterol oxidase [Gammaproteobacteria bacterium]
MINIKYDYDYIVIGSGFGGSVSAMRLAQKGYKVAIIEEGKTYQATDFAQSNWNLKKYLWLPKIKLFGIQRLNLLKDIFVLSGAGVGGGSLNYANTLYTPKDEFFNNSHIKQIGNKQNLLKYYELAKKMLGATINPKLGIADEILKDTIKEYDKEKSCKPTTVAVYFGTEGKTVTDPYFYGEGPDRTGCDFCGCCMTGCRKNSKNTLDKNYLYFAKKFNCQIIDNSKVIKISPLDEKGATGYKITTSKSDSILSKRQTYTCRATVLSAGVLGTLKLLLKMRAQNIMPNINKNIGKFVRTNSESIISVKARNKNYDFSTGVAITSSVYPDNATHIEPVRYGAGHDAMSLLSVLLTDGGGKIPRFVRYLKNVLFNPIDFLKVLNPIGSAKKNLILLVMQTCDNYLNLSLKHNRLTSCQSDKKNPVYIPIANDFCRKIAKKINGIACGVITEVYMNIPITAHIMGGCNIGNQDDTGVTDKHNRLNNYQNFLIIDASTIPANLGVNPSLSITAFAEKAMSHIPAKKGEKIKYLEAEKQWQTTELLQSY